MATIVVLFIAVGVVVLVFYWSGKYGGRGRTKTTSLRRGVRSHVTAKGRPKVGYASRDDAEAHARMLTLRDGQAMNVYRCDNCAKWHVGHSK